MKKTEYMAPEMEVVKLTYNTILMASGDSPEPGGEIDGEGPAE